MEPVAQLVDRPVVEGLPVRASPWWTCCVMSLSKTLFPLLSTGSTQEDLPDMAEKMVD